MKILVAGASGLIGSSLTRHLTASGHDVIRLVRRNPRGPGEFGWDPNRQRIEPKALDGVQAVINLSGAGIAARPWTRSRVETLYASRLNSTRLLVSAMNRAEQPPAVFVSQSASGFYGDRRDQLLPEDASSGTGILADICRKWEAAALQGPSSTRTVITRTGIVLAPEGGALPKLLLPLRLGLGGPIGSGRQWWPWITLDDEVRAFEFLLTSAVSGPVNLCAPQPETMGSLVSALAGALGKPAGFRVPETVLTAVLGDLPRELLLASARMTPAKLTAAGFVFGQSSVDQLAAWVTLRLGRGSGSA